MLQTGNELTVHGTKPLGLSKSAIYVPDGATLDEMVDELARQWGYDKTEYTAEALINGDPIPANLWPKFKPKAGTSIVINLFPAGAGGGSGGKIAASILSLVVGLFTFGVGAIGTIFATTGALLTPAITLGVSPLLLSNLALMAVGGAAIAGGIQSALSPAPTQPFTGEIPTANPSFQLQAPTNSIKANKPVRRVLGQMRVWPELARAPFTEIVGEDQFLRMLFCVGYGPLDITEPKVGETPISSFQVNDSDEINYIVHGGFDDDDPLSLTNIDISENRSFNITLDVVGDGLDNSINTDVDTIGMIADFQFPGGLIRFRNTGEPVDTTVGITIEYREAGTADPWVAVVPKDPLPEGVTYEGLGEIRINNTLQGSFARGIAFDFPSADQWEVRAHLTYERHVEDDPDVNAINLVAWNVLRSIQQTTPNNVDNLCLIELRIKSTDQLNGTLNDFNVLAESIYPTRAVVPGEWNNQRRTVDLAAGRIVKSRAYDLAFAEILRGPGNELPVPDERIDSDSLAAWQTDMDALGRELNGSLESFRTVYDVLSDICGAGRASVQLVEGKYGVTQNKEQTLIVDHLSHRNSSDFSVQKRFRKKTHAIRVQFIDPEVGYQPNTVIVYNDGFTASNSTVFDDLNLWGVTSKETAYVDGRFSLAERELRPRIVECTVNLRSLRVLRGDMVRVTFTTMGVGLASGRIRDVTLASGDTEILSANVDEVLPYGTKAYAVRIQKSDGITVVADVIAEPGPINRFRFVVSQVFTGVAPQPGDLFLFGESASESAEMIVAEVKHQEGMRARLALVDHSPAIYSSDTDPIPAFDPQLSEQIPLSARKPAKPTIVSVQSDESALQVLSDGTCIPRILLNWAYEPNTVVAEGFEVQFRNATDGQYTQIARVSPGDRRLYILNVDEGGIYDVRIRSYSRSSSVSEFATVSGHQVIGKSTPPPPVQNLRRTSIDRIVWDYEDAPVDHLGFQIRVSGNPNAVWETASAVGASYITEQFVNPDEYIPPLGAFLLFVAAVDRGGNVSTAEVIQVDLGFEVPPNQLYLFTHKVFGWAAGTRTNCSVEGGSGDLIADSDPSDLFWSASDTDLFWDPVDANDFWVAGYLEWDYTSIWLGFTVSGANIALATVDGALILDIGSDELNNVKTEIRFSDVGSFGASGVTDWEEFTTSHFIEAAGDYQIRISAPASTTRNRLTNGDVSVNKEDTVEFLNDFLVATNGVALGTGVAIPIGALTNSFRLITTVVATISNPAGGGGTAGYSFVVHNKYQPIPNLGLPPITVGPTVEVLDAAGVPTDATVDITIRGYI